MKNGELSIKTTSRMEFIDITGELAAALEKTGITSGICCLFNPHTTAGLTINEGADPAVKSDLIAALNQIVPLDYPYKHLEGNSPAHLMATITGSSLQIIIKNGKPMLGTWQKIFFGEFDGPRQRRVWFQIYGE